MEVLVSVADQRLVLLRDGDVVSKYRISTSKFGVGDSYGSYRTPLGKLRVCEKIGDSLDPGTVIKNRSATGEILKVNAPGRDPIVTRIIWLEGIEEQNRNARTRGIYIHGTPEERTLGIPKSWGCIRMRSVDVMDLYDQISTGTPVEIIAEHLPRLEKYRPPPPPVLLVENAPPATVKESPAPVAKQLPNPAPAQKSVAAKSSPSTTAPIVSGTPESTPTSHAPEHAVPRSATALNAMKGSILLAGLPSAPKYENASRVAVHSPAAEPADTKTADKP
jgi:hypothetical protein